MGFERHLSDNQVYHSRCSHFPSDKVQCDGGGYESANVVAAKREYLFYYVAISIPVGTTYIFNVSTLNPIPVNSRIFVSLIGFSVWTASIRFSFKIEFVKVYGSNTIELKATHYDEAYKTSLTILIHNNDAFSRNPYYISTAYTNA